jgi:hypothetical protein
MIEQQPPDVSESLVRSVDDAGVASRGRTSVVVASAAWPPTSMGRPQDPLGVSLARCVAQRSAVPQPRQATLARATWVKAAGTIWTKDTGRQFEDLCAANLGGNFPTVDSFESGVAISLKTIDIARCFQGEAGRKSLTATMNRYREALAAFGGWKNWAGKTVKKREITRLRLKVGIPPRPATGADEYDANRRALESFAETKFAGVIALNWLDERHANLRTAKVPSRYVEDAEPAKVGDKRKWPHTTEPKKSARVSPVKLDVEIVEVPGIWTGTPGIKYEQAAFPNDAQPAANIGGNFPTIDDFRNGVATSLKTINIVENFDSYLGFLHLGDLIRGYHRSLEKFNGESWPVARNYAGPQSLLSSDGSKVVVKGADIQSLRLQIAIPPVTAILAAKRTELGQAGSDHAKQAALSREIDIITANAAEVHSWAGAFQRPDGKQVDTVVEERD